MTHTFQYPAETHPLVSIITVNYNQTELTCALLDSIRANPYINIEVIVVDNASRENPALRFEKSYPEVKFLRSEQNLGFAGGNNLGLDKAKGDYFFFVNNDAELTTSCIFFLLEAFIKIPKLGAISPMLCYDQDRNAIAGDLIQYCGTTLVHPFTARNSTIGERQRDVGQFKTLQPTAYGHGAALMVPRYICEKVGLMSNDFFLYYEELDWCARIRKAGFEIYVEPRSKVYHKESVTVGPESPLKTYYLNRNRIYFMRRNYGTSALLGFTGFLLFVTLPINLLRYALKGKWQLARSFLAALVWNFKNRLLGSTANPDWLPAGPPKPVK